MEPPRRRRRPALACDLCRRRKIRCNRETPCNNCIRSKVDACVYKTPPNQLGSMSDSPPSDIESMKSRIKELENLLQETKVSPTPTTRQVDLTPATTPGSHVEIQTTAYPLTGTFHIHHGDPNLGQLPAVNRSIAHKHRVFGQSHWFNACLLLVRDLVEMIDEHSRESTNTLILGIQRVKHTGRLIKTRRTPEWPCSSVSELPSREIADILLEHYFSTVESIYRIVHEPSFRTDYEAIWEPGARVSPTFLILLKLALAIGSAVYDDKFTLRSTAIRWLYEAQTWLADPTLKHRLGLEYFQIHILVILVRDWVGPGEDLNWVSTGSLLRTAIHFGMHRDPVILPGGTLYANEMHRRLWNTILELCVQVSLNAGVPPMLSMDDFDTRPPGNFNDNQLMNEDDVPRPDDEFTDTSVARELRNTFPIRLSITKFLNSIRTSGSYRDTLSLDSEFRSSYKGFRSAFQSFQSTFGEKKPHPIQVGLVDVIMLRYLVSLHMPFFAPALHDPAYARSRKVCVDSSSKIWSTLVPLSTPPPPYSTSPHLPSNDAHYLQRIITSGSGFFRLCMMQTLLVISVELREQLKDDDGLGLMPMGPDLFSIVRDGVRVNMDCIQSGETNIKGYLFAKLMLTSIEGIRQGLARNAIASSLVSTTIEVESECLKILQDMLASVDSGNTINKTAIQGVESDVQAPFDGANSSLEEWDFTATNFNLDENFDFMAWMLDSDVVQPTPAWD